MDIEKQVAERKAKGWNVECKTTYLFQERSADGRKWYTLTEFDKLEDARDCMQRYFEIWYSRAFDSIDQIDFLRIVMRHTAEVVL